MNIFVFVHSQGIDLFCRPFIKRKRGNRFLWVPNPRHSVHHEYLTPEEVGQLMGGN